MLHPAAPVVGHGEERLVPPLTLPLELVAAGLLRWWHTLVGGGTLHARTALSNVQTPITLYLEQQNHATALGQAQVLSRTGKGSKKVGGLLEGNTEPGVFLCFTCVPPSPVLCSVRLTAT